MLEGPQSQNRLMELPHAGTAEETADLLQLILSQVGEGILVINSAREVIFLNQIAVQLLGTAEPPPPGADWSTYYGLFLPDKITPYPSEKTPLHRALRGQALTGVELYIRRENHRGRWLSITTRPLRNRAGEIWGAVSVFRDVTPERHAAQALQDSEQRFRALFENNSVGILVSSLEGGVLTANEAFTRMLGYQLPELQGMRAHQIYFDPAFREKLIRKLMRKNDLADVEIALRHSSGEPVFVLARMSLLDLESAGMGGHIILSAIDITGRKRQEQALRESESRFEAFMQAFPGGAFLKDSQRRYVYYNQAAQFWGNFERLPEIGKTDEEIFPLEIAKTNEESDRLVLDQGIRVNRIDSAVGSRGVILQVNKFPIFDAAGKPCMIGGVVLDITEQRRLEEQLRLGQKMEAIGRLAGGVAHDFNNLLTIISGYAHMLADGFNSNRVSASAFDYANEIVKAAERAAALTGQLLVFSRRQVIQPVVIDLADTLQGLSRMLRRTLGENIEISIETQRTPCHIKADSGQMEQLILNLALNARDAMPIGGRLAIRLAKVTRSKGRFALLEFADSGRGLDESARERVFEPYFSLKNPATFGGLGLSTVYGIVQQNQGEIEVSSEAGAGSTFQIYLPLASAAETDKPATATPNRRNRAETILLVEDEEGVRNLVSSMLRSQGYRVFEAEHGKHALEVFERHGQEVELLLTDVIMPRMSGHELARRLKTQAPGLKVMYMSGYTDDIVAREGIVSENTVLLHKPFTLDGLLRKLHEAFGD
jgi:PAS domain S-box-containing protein